MITNHFHSILNFEIAIKQESFDDNVEYYQEYYPSAASINGSDDGKSFT
jgi:hypothetical protein